MHDPVQRIKGAAEEQLRELDLELPQRVQEVDGFVKSLSEIEIDLFGEDLGYAGQQAAA